LTDGSAFSAGTGPAEVERSDHLSFSSDRAESISKRALSADIVWYGNVVPAINLLARHPTRQNERELGMLKVRVLCVGVDQKLSELAQSLEGACGGEWEGAFAGSITDATEELGTSPFDILVVDASSSRESVVDFLATARNRWPDVLRYAITDTSDKSGVLQLMGETHQIIAKPWEPQELVKQLRNAHNIRQSLADEKLRARISGIKTLPCLPATYNQLVTELHRKDSSPSRVADLISEDAAVTAKVLHVANSAYFGLARRVDDILQAVNLLGTDTVQSLVLSAGVLSQFESVDIAGSSIDEISSSSARIGAKSRLLAHSLGLQKRAVEDSLLSGMLLDLGRLLMAKYFHSEMQLVVEAMKQHQLPLQKAEQRVLGTDSAAIGAYLLSLWGMADPIVEAVALHRKPSECPEPVIGSLATVHMAWAIDNDERNTIGDDSESSVDSDYLTSLGILEQLPMIRGFCAGAIT
jgi:HD-like signal output (HDOD) protein